MVPKCGLVGVFLFCQDGSDMWRALGKCSSHFNVAERV